MTTKNDLEIKKDYSAMATKAMSEAFNVDPYKHFHNKEATHKLIENMQALASKTGAGGVVIALSNLGDFYPGLVSQPFLYSATKVVEILEEYGYKVQELTDVFSGRNSLFETIELEGFNPNGEVKKEDKFGFYKVTWDENNPLFQQDFCDKPNFLKLVLKEDHQLKVTNK